LFTKEFLERLTNVLEAITYGFTFIGALAGVAYVAANRPLRRAIQAETAEQQRRSENQRQEMQLQIASAQTEQERIKEENAQLQLRIAEANRTTEQERLARIRIEERLAGWRLDAAAQQRLLEKVKPYKVRFELWVHPSEFRFMQVIDRILREAGWAWQKPTTGNQIFDILLDGKAAINYNSGITIEVAQERWNDFGPAATALTHGLIAEGIPARGHIVPRGADPSAIHVVIGNRD
jgi:hypothetical protein